MRFFSKFSDSDKRALLALIVFFIAILSYWGIRASFFYRAEAVTAFRESRMLFIDIYSYGKKISMIETLKKSKTNTDSSQTLLTLASSSAKDKNIAFKRFQPDGENLLQLWLEEVNFNVMIWWLSEIESKHGIQVAQISVERTQRDGFVNARITLAR